MWNPEADIGDVEEWGRVQLGFIYLARRIRPNSAGYGERRGGNGYAHVAVFYGSGDDVVQNLNMGKVFVITGPYGGYPGSSSYALLGRGVKFDEIVANKLVCPP